MLALLVILMLTATSRCLAEPVPLAALDEMVAKLPHVDASGEVVTTSGQAVAGADVFLYYESALDAGFRSRLAGRTTTDAQGKFIFKQAVVWEPLLESYGSGNLRKYDVIARDTKLGIAYTVFLESDPTDRLKITMKKPEYTDVNVNDTTAKPLEGVRVFLSGAVDRPRYTAGTKYEYCSFRVEDDIGLSSGLTDKTGNVHLLGTTGGYFSGLKEGYVKDSSDKKMTLYPAAQISGRVTDPDGKPVPSAAVLFRYENNRISERLVAITDPKGRYVLKNLPATGFSYSFLAQDKKPGTVYLSADDKRIGSELVCKTLDFKLNPGDNLTKDIKMVKGFVLAGQVIDTTTGKPVPRIDLVRSTEDDSGYLKNFNADENGRFRLVFSPGRHVMLYWERAHHGEYVIDKNQANHMSYEGVMNQSRTDVVLKARLWQVCTLKGTVIGLDGKPRKQAKVYMHTDVPALITDEDGAFTLKVAPADRDYDLYACDSTKKTAALVHLKAGTTSTTLRLQPTHAYKGRVVATDGLPSNNLQFYFDLLLNDSAHYLIRCEPKTSADGTFTAPNLCPKGTYYAWWSSNNEKNRDYGNGNATIDLTRLKPDEPIRLEAKHFVNTLLGNVQDGQGKSIAGAQIKVISSYMLPGDLRSKSFISDKNGDFSIERLSAGLVILRVAHTEYAPHVIQIPSDGIDAVVKLSPKGKDTILRLKAVDGQQKPVAQAPLSIETYFFDARSNKSFTKNQTLLSDAKGQAEFRLKSDLGEANRILTSGQVWCDIPGYDFAIGSFRAGEESDLTLVMHKGGEHWTGKIVDASQKSIVGAKIIITGVRPQDVGEFFLLTENPSLMVTSAKDGKFELTRFSKQCGVILTASTADLTQDNVIFDPERNIESNVTLAPGGTLSGKVVIGPSQKPVVRGQVYLESGASRGKNALVNRDGAFTVSGLPGGDYKVRYFSEDEEYQKYILYPSPRVNVIEGKTSCVTVPMEEGVSVKGRLIDPATGQAPKGSFSIDCALQGGERFGGGGPMQADGSWTATLVPGTYRIRFYSRPDGGITNYPKPITIEKGKVYDHVILEWK